MSSRNDACVASGIAEGAPVWPEFDGAGEDGGHEKRVFKSRERGKGHVKDEVRKKQH